ncbi:PREDICTED: uncharacterized protein LOC109128287 [Camelina sativa]|uniref:Uncharacterized protein LOC109128287 n=1 Tax=Camelina sativa TaxID=90675 RepID=A0ABM1QSW8_CAMSA|nr:PREDICTED: uncharacterized protein LOC109128287 [Camelina sativa]
MGIISSTDLKPEHKSQNNNQSPSVGVSSSTWRRYDDFMKGGGCKEVFTDFLDCVYEAEKKKEVAGPCYPMLQKCIEAHSDYYQPILASDKKNCGERFVRRPNESYTAFNGFPR